MAKFNSEQELGPPVVTWLRERGFDVYQEVKHGGVADLVGLAEAKPQRLVVVELKLSLSLDVLAQADSWRKQAHLVYVAVPRVKGGADKGRYFAYRVAESFGIGVLELERHGVYAGLSSVEIRQKVEAPIRRRIESGRYSLLAALRPEHKQKEWARAGAAGGGHWTEFKHTASRLRRVVEGYPAGVSMRQALLELKEHHYASDASARGSLSALACQGVIDGITTEYVGKTLMLKSTPKPAK